MRIAYYIKKESLRSDERVAALLGDLAASGCIVEEVRSAPDVSDGTDALLSLGGDGTFLDAARIAVPSGVPGLGVNFGRLGFLSENDPSCVLEPLLGGKFTVEERGMLKVDVPGLDLDFPYALNEVSVFRTGAAMLGIDVSVNSQELPTYWADGLLVATSSGSTAYSLSVGGPICMPDSRVLIVSPISPHNLNVRPLIVADGSEVDITLRSRTGDAQFSLDNTVCPISSGSGIVVRSADVRLRRLRLGESSFINALKSRLLWGQDVRNSEKVNL